MAGVVEQSVRARPADGSEAHEVGPVRAALVFVRGNWFLLTCMLVAAVAAVVLRHSVFSLYSVNRDEPVYVLQANTLLSGHLTLPVYPDLAFFQPWLTGVHNGHLIFEFPPGFPAVLAVSGLLTGSMVPALGAVAALTVLGVYLVAIEAGGGRPTALVAAAMATCTPLLLIQSALYLSYESAFCAGLFASAALLRGARTGSARPLVVGGALLGVVFLTRPFDAVLWGIPFVVLVVACASSTSAAFRRLLPIIAGFVPPAILMLAFNAAVTGTPTVFPITAADPLNGFGFGTRRIMVGSPPVTFEPSDAWRAAGQNFRGGREWVLGGLAGIALAVVGAYLARRRGSTYAMLGLILTFGIGNGLYWGIMMMAVGTGLFGPEYYLPMLVPVLVLGATALTAVWLRKRVVAVGVAIVFAVVTIPTLRDKIDVNRRLGYDGSKPYYDALGSRDRPNSLVFVPGGFIDPFLLREVPFAGNSPQLDDEQLYAVDLGPRVVDLVARTSRTPYLLRVGYGPNLTRHVTVEPVALIDTPMVRVRMQITNPGQSNVVTAFLDTGTDHVNVVVDEHSTRGAEYEIEWLVAAPSVSSGDAIMTPLGYSSINTGARFGRVSEGPRDDIRELRVPVHVDGDSITALLPGQYWRTQHSPWGWAPVPAPRSSAVVVDLAPEAP